MKILLPLFILFVGLITANGQTNIINIYNSRVIINSPAPLIQDTNTIKKTNYIVLPQYTVDRLRWESMLEQRRQYTFRNYLKNRP
jgi:hypothetical protein